ncbi:3660_t:CDS:2 [Rhizophagus irregularis]|nr:3660_t:CDS:2 [Rhizophagus irregularis]
MNIVVNINGQFIPGTRTGHDAVLIGKKLYFIGGHNYNKETELISDFFYYDLEAGLSDAKLVDLRSQKGINLPYMIWHTANIGGANQDSIFMIGGVGTVELSNNLVYRFDTRTNTTSIPIIQGNIPPRRRNTDSVSYGGKIYIFGGLMKDVNNNIIYYNNFDILDTVNLVWNVGNPVNAPLPRYYYTATLVNGVIYYIGGSRKSSVTSNIRANIYLYDIATNTWSFRKVIAGDIPESRTGHSAVLRVHNAITVLISATPTIALFDTSTFIWSTPQLENINTPKLIDTNIPKLAYHTATLIDNIMFVAFGNPVIIGLSTGLAVIGLGTIVAFTLIYRRKKNQNSATGGEIDSLSASTSGVTLQIPPDTQHSPTPTLAQSQGYSPGQEYSTLPLSQQERFSKDTSNYFPGSETLPS